jgi:hypothetical protein
MDPDLDLERIQVDRDSSKQSSVAEASIVTFHMIDHVAFYEINVRSFHKESWTILRKYHWIKMVHDNLVAKGEHVKHGHAFTVTSSASRIFNFPNFSSDVNMASAHEDDREPSKEKLGHLKHFIADLAYSNYQYEFVHRFFAPVRHLCLLHITYPRTPLHLHTHKDTITFIDPIKSGEMYQPVLTSGESDPEHYDLCSFHDTHLKPFQTIEEEMVALRTGIVAIKTLRHRITEVDTMFLNAFAFRLREATKIHDASVPPEKIEKLGKTLSKAGSKSLEKKKAEAVQAEAKDS